MQEYRVIFRPQATPKGNPQTAHPIEISCSIGRRTPEICVAVQIATVEMAPWHRSLAGVAGGTLDYALGRA